MADVCCDLQLALVNSITANTTFLTDLILRFACRSTVVITRRKHLFPTLCAPLCSYSRVVLWWSHNLQIAKIEKSYAYFYVTSLAHLWQGICFLLRYDIRICPKLMLWQLNHLHLEILTGFRYRAVYQTVTYFHFIILFQSICTCHSYDVYFFFLSSLADAQPKCIAKGHKQVWSIYRPRWCLFLSIVSCRFVFSC